MFLVPTFSYSHTHAVTKGGLQMFLSGLELYADELVCLRQTFCTISPCLHTCDSEKLKLVSHFQNLGTDSFLPTYSESHNFLGHWMESKKKYVTHFLKQFHSNNLLVDLFSSLWNARRRFLLLKLISAELEFAHLLVRAKLVFLLIGFIIFLTGQWVLLSLLACVVLGRFICRIPCSVSKQFQSWIRAKCFIFVTLFY